VFPLRRQQRRTIAALAALWLAVWYGVGVGLAGMHLAATEHHVEPLHDGHACSHEDAAAAPTAPAFDDAAADDHCCHLLHEALPGTTTGPVLDLRSQGAAKRIGAVAAPSGWTVDARRLALAVRAGAVGIPPGGDLATGAGRAPPVSLHA
jgi:hypothetical protein